MLDIKFIRKNKEIVKKAVKDKQLKDTIDIDELIQVDSKLRVLTEKLDVLRHERNELNNKIKSSQGQQRQKHIKKNTQLKTEVKSLEEKIKPLKEKFDELMLWVPNVPASDVPYGEGEVDNKVVRTEGKKQKFDFKPKTHLEIGEDLGIVDVKRGVKIGGFRSYFIVGKGMLLEQAILRYALDYMVSQGFTPMNVPVMVNKEWFVGTGYFPWGEEDHYRTQDDQALIGTAEVSLTAYYANEVLEEKNLPIKLTGLSSCFRREVGSHGKDLKGVFRVHFFNKVEQVVLLPADEELSRKWHNKMLKFSENILKGLELPYQVVAMCTGDMGSGQRKKYDIETWFPGQDKYRETHSDSYFLDFQSRRLKMRYKSEKGETKYVYTINNTVAATPRLLAAIIENYQQEDGSVIVPEVLRKYTGFDAITR